MTNNSFGRRVLSLVLMTSGGALIFLAPGQVWIGAVMVAVGFGIELIGFAILHRAKAKG